MHITTINAQRGHQFEGKQKGDVERFRERKGKGEMLTCGCDIAVAHNSHSSGDHLRDTAQDQAGLGPDQGGAVKTPPLAGRFW